MPDVKPPSVQNPAPNNTLAFSNFPGKVIGAVEKEAAKLIGSSPVPLPPPGSSKFAHAMFDVALATGGGMLGGIAGVAFPGSHVAFYTILVCAGVSVVSIFLGKRK